ncbi:succinate-semialdehyde dehydrogenase [Pelobium manganitolerans]|uniref:Succinate-semialdehyde dehydrogenase n=1 Tax=Pelobium manganitolerans TaxID=1842495 RepID=A0A419S5F7_9SPHI|nr:NAD-dependent succinate-semialdehyde dehydrogenase [Pelobium manganitolerans]RKD16085.1 succinate-semialdehyde dehydrogenase [Pelobium manganitolerans]
MSIKSTNPYNNQVVGTYTELNKQEIEQKIEAAQHAWLQWKKISFEQKSKMMIRLGELLLAEKEDLAKTITAEMGKAIKESRAEIEKCASVCTYYAKNTQEFLKDELVETDAQKSYISYQPLGVILAVMPWNFPFWQVFRFLAPNLMGGNCGLLKHASNVSGCALAIEKLVSKAGFPDNVFSVLLVSGKNVAQVIEHKHVKAVTLTGSTEAGKKVAEKAGSVLKKCVLELGGSDAYVILEDADLEQSAELCVNARLINNGQSCIAAKRFIVLKPIAEKFTQLFTEKMRAKTFGDPSNEEFELGTMANKTLRNQLHQQVEDSVKAGAKCILGGRIPEGEGAFYPPTVLINVKKGMPAFDDEMFGPVASIIVADDLNHAMDLANDTDFGLGGAVFTSDTEKGNDVARNQIEAGSVFVNANVKSDPRLPFGGIKQSGYGRELGKNGLLEFMNIKTVCVG